MTRVGPPSYQEAGSKWQDFTMGVNWKPNKNVTFRSEVRWDSAQNGDSGGLAALRRRSKEHAVPLGQRRHISASKR